jgi:hypothetical protein
MKRFEDGLDSVSHLRFLGVLLWMRQGHSLVTWRAVVCSLSVSSVMGFKSQGGVRATVMGKATERR